MRMKEAEAIIHRGGGCLVHFERIEGSLLACDHFPDVRAGENPIATEDDAWLWAARFAAATRGSCVNVYVIHAEDFTPVKGYEQRAVNRAAGRGDRTPTNGGIE